MNAIDMLERQHRQVERLFADIPEAEGPEKRQLFIELADALAVHATIEERHFYPAVRERRTEDLVAESFEEHLEIKQVLADLLRTEIDDDDFDNKLQALEEDVSHHVEEEEGELFPKVRQLMTPDQLEAIGQEMLATATELLPKQPHKQVSAEVGAAPGIY